MIGAIHSVTRATERIPPRIIGPANAKIKAAIIHLLAPGIVHMIVEAIAFDCTEVITTPQVTIAMIAKTAP